MPWRFEHQPCNGTGQIQNPLFEACRDWDEKPSCAWCKVEHPDEYAECSRGEIIPCEGCNGTGHLVIDSEEWGAGVWI